MGFDIHFGVLPQMFCLVLARCAGIIGSVPFYGGQKVSPFIRAGAALALALLLTPLAPESWVTAARGMHNLSALLLGVLGEIVLGAAVGLVVNFFTSIFNIAGDMIAHCSGLMMAREVDPISEVSNTMISNLLQTVFVLIVVLNDGHLVLLRLMAESFFKTPPQAVLVTKNWVFSFITLGAIMFEYGMRLAAPVIGAEFILNLGFALIARVAPDVNILFLSLPVRLFGTLAIFGFVLHLGGYFFNSTVEKMLAALAGILT